MLNLLRRLQRRYDLTYLFIAHDLAVVKHVAERVGVMYLGKLVEVAPAEALFATPRHPYTRALLAAIPTPSPGADRGRPLVDGDVPSPIDPPPGCRFHTRCRFVAAQCRTVEPLLETIDGHAVACHRWRELAPEHVSAPTTSPGAERLARLQAAFSSDIVA